MAFDQSDKCRSNRIQHIFFKETLINWLHERIASLRGIHPFAYFVDMYRCVPYAYRFISSTGLF
ncbi:MAG: hypothetical protein KGN35_09820, partial [Betaproteobacteria bacterium]|nr:hypothetical protein [Betaproteobacteria bacterium]